MITQEPVVRVGIFEHSAVARGTMRGRFAVSNVIGLEGDFEVRSERGTVIFQNAGGRRILSEDEIRCQPLEAGTVLLKDVKIGVAFHWERNQDQVFQGKVRFVAQDGKTIAAINEIELEPYLKSVIASEMSATAPLELLRAHAIVSRSWLAALQERRRSDEQRGTHGATTIQRDNEIIRWYGHEDHAIFDVCADDHCQRYQGIAPIVSETVGQAMDSTRGVFLVMGDKICDTRYSKACGGLSENFENEWEDVPVPYLQCVSDSTTKHRPLRTEQDADRWIRSRPEAYCNTTDSNILRQVLPSFDQETMDFFRWTIAYSREELEELIRKKSGIDFGTLHDLVPVERGLSGRIIKLKIVGSKKTLTVGKGLEIRKWLSKSHLYSSAFTVDVERDAQNVPVRFVLNGAGWGHGVGLCQIGAAVMATQGFKAEDILSHYFKGAKLEKLY
ncbi:MAG TPA: SpoIID/LytB domain-containing protein [Bacteroidota bacterium]|nr:SpoIID/LytB domain-containing protein [Bacteroidota bacterium]